MIDNDWKDNVVSVTQQILPLVLGVILVLSAYFPIYIGIFNNIRPDLGLAAIYFWLLHRPDLFDLKSTLFLGLVDGFVGSTAVGLTLFAYLLMYVLMVNLRRFFVGRSFVVVWYGFMALSLLTLFVKWGLATIYYGSVLPISILIFSYLLGAAVYPIISTIFALVQNVFLQDDEL